MTAGEFFQEAVRREMVELVRSQAIYAQQVTICTEVTTMLLIAAQPSCKEALQGHLLRDSSAKRLRAFVYAFASLLMCSALMCSACLVPRICSHTDA